MKKQKKTERFELRLTPDEKRQIKAYADKYGLSMAETVLSIVQRVFAIKEQEDETGKDNIY